MEPESLEAKIEALLFINGEPMPIKKMANVLGVKEEEIQTGLRSLASILLDSKRGVMLIAHEGSAQLTTKPQFKALAETVIKAELQEELTPAALETLSIITYGGTLPRSIIDYIRGVNSSFILRALLIRGLIERSHDPAKGNTYQYAPSFELLRHLGVTNFESLPDFNRLHGLLTELGKGNATS